MNIFRTKCIILCALVSCATSALAGDTPSPKPDGDFPYVIMFETGSVDFAQGDAITISELRGSTNRIVQGGTYCITGAYTLDSQDAADLCFYATTTNKTASKVASEQSVRVSKGSGSFRLVKRMDDPGYLHLSFYAHGHNVGGVYFGQEPWVMRRKPAPHSNSAGGAQKYIPKGPNDALIHYLGDPVPPPAELDAAYSKDGLARAIDTAAANANIKIAKVEIDDSEFPFLVALDFANNGDKEKLKAQIAKMPTYAVTGGVGGDTTYATSITPTSVFPPNSYQTIYHRLLLRESVLFERFTATQ